ncbi:MAG: shikimate dehydrogenase [Alphaproteobacteria bacterium]|nr:shikimate dehydrogenase [Alphaproteobacteria bacterium]
MTVSGKARVAGVMAWPVAHSLSPRLHGHWIARYGLDAAYVPMAVPPEKLEAAVRALPALGFAGANVTVPHKEAAFAAMDSLSDEARAIGAVNTIIVRKDGSLFGDTTDGRGFLANIRDAHPGWSARGKAVAIVGAGGAAKAIAWALHADGADEVRIINRTPARAVALAQALGGRAKAVAWEHSAAALEDVALVANATTLGMKGQPMLEVDLGPLPQNAIVTDIVYTPLETDLLRRARQRGNPAVDGLGMLLHQAKPGFAAWFGKEPEVDAKLHDFVRKGP